MKVIDFPKQAWMINRSMKPAALKEFDDFGREIELLRRSKLLMTMLECRSKEVAVVSLEDIKRNMGITA